MKTSTLLLPLYPLLGLAATIQHREPAANAAVDVVTYHPYTPGGRTQYYGDTAVFKVTTTANSPLVADYSALAKHFVPIQAVNAEPRFAILGCVRSRCTLRESVAGVAYVSGKRAISSPYTSRSGK
jgi:hypothetical protein